MTACKMPGREVRFDAAPEQYVRLAVALGERDPDSLDFYFGPESLVAQTRGDPPTEVAILQQATALEDALERENLTGRDKERGDFLRLQLRAMRLRAQMITGKLVPFDQESATLFGMTAGRDDAAEERAQTRKEVAGLLGAKTGLAHGYSLYDAQFVVARDKVPTVLDEALQACRAATLAHVAMPAGEHVDVEYVFHKPWSAYSRYLGHGHSLIQVNMDYPLTVDRVLNLACHEGYPGHHVFNTLRDAALVGGKHEQEWMVQPTFSPQSLVSEAAASYAPEVVFRPDERLRVERDVLFPLAGLDPAKAAKYLQVERLVASLNSAEPAIARDYLDGRLEFVRAADALERETLMEHAETLLLYLNEYRSYMLTYTAGRKMVEEIVEQGSPTNDIRWQRYTSFMDRPVITLGDH